MKSIVIIIAILISSFGIAQSEKKIIKEIEKYRVKTNKEFKNPKASILDSLDVISFKGLDFYPIDLKFRVEAKLTYTPNEKPFLMKTSTERLPEYVKYAIAEFTMNGKDLKLNIYKPTRPIEKPEDDYVFIPITDLTSGDGSYGGGRYLEVDVPTGKTMIIDFNLLYNPYCAYSTRWSCPIPPEENDLLIRIEAGVKTFGEH